MALLLILTMIACVDNGNGEESPSDTAKPQASASGTTGEDDPVEESSTPIDNESELTTEAPESSETEPATPETKPETTKDNSGVIELPRDTF